VAAAFEGLSGSDCDSSHGDEPSIDVEAEAEDEAEDGEEEPQPESEPGDEPDPECFDDEEEQKPKVSKQGAALKPGARGSRSCLCSGEVLVMLGHYGWLASLSDIDHPDAVKNGGRIYFLRRDVVGGVRLEKGDKVAFYLYADSQGLGAEECRLESCMRSKTSIATQAPSWKAWQGRTQRAAPFQPQWQRQQHPQHPQHQLKQQQLDSLRPNAAEFVPHAACADVKDEPEKTAPTMNAKAAEFVPGMSASAVEFVPAAQKSNLVFVPPAPQKPAVNPSLNFFAFNDAYLSDSDDEGSTSAGGSGSSDEGGAESGCDRNDGSHQTSSHAPVLAQLCSAALKEEAHVGMALLLAADSDSEDEEDDFSPPGLALPPPALAPPPGLAHPSVLPAVPVFRPPPGLSLP